jgi:hypothetical protein
MYSNYRYMRDALLELPLPFTEEEREWLFKKNKRRFALQLVNFTRLSMQIKSSAKSYLMKLFQLAITILIPCKTKLCNKNVKYRL